MLTPVVPGARVYQPADVTPRSPAIQYPVDPGSPPGALRAEHAPTVRYPVALGRSACRASMPAAAGRVRFVLVPLTATWHPTGGYQWARPGGPRARGRILSHLCGTLSTSRPGTSSGMNRGRIVDAEVGPGHSLGPLPFQEPPRKGSANARRRAAPRVAAGAADGEGVSRPGEPGRRAGPSPGAAAPWRSGDAMALALSQLRRDVPGVGAGRASR